MAFPTRPVPPVTRMTLGISMDWILKWTSGKITNKAHINCLPLFTATYGIGVKMGEILRNMDIKVLSDN